MPHKIAYIVSRFPHLPETFILREMIHLEKLGWQIELYPLIIQRQELIHEEARPWLSRVHAVPWSSLDLWKANLASMLATTAPVFFAVVAGITGKLPQSQIPWAGSVVVPACHVDGRPF
jgi:hypothetical protein